MNPVFLIAAIVVFFVLLSVFFLFRYALSEMDKVPPPFPNENQEEAGENRETEVTY
jgi:hypothetical protein